MKKTSFDQLLMDVFREMGAHRPEQILPGWSLSLSEIYALSLLAERAPVSQQELGTALGLEKSTITRLVQQLERRGWLRRDRDDRDSRLRLLCLTEQGERITEQMQEHMFTRHAELFDQLAPEERAALLTGLSALLRTLQQHPASPASRLAAAE